jgi:hypothetical protein
MESAEYKTVLISGAGELGSRYLQSMVSCAIPLTVHLHSNNTRSLKICQQRWVDVDGKASPHQLVMCQDLSALPDRIDLVIVSSTAESRPLLVESIAKRAVVSYWLIEKVLAQSVPDIEQMLTNLSTGVRSWVNYYMLADAWYAEIKNHLLPGTRKHMTVHGGAWGLACNSLHFIHLHAWFSESHLVSLNTGRLSGEWHESKRPGNWEIYGELSADFSDGGRLDLLSGPGSVKYSLSLQDGPYTWQIDEASGIARRTDGFEIKGRVPYQSERKLVEEILTSGTCRLPTFASVAAADQIFIGAMLNHWRQHIDPAALLVPIT